MSEIRCCCLFLLVHIVTGADITSKFVCPGDSVQVFTTANFDNCNAVVSLFKNGDRKIKIATWTLRNCALNSSLLPEYNDTIYFNKNGTILIHDIHPWDEGRYIMTKEDTLPMTYEEQICVMAVPTKDCRPTIDQLGNSLSASLNHDVCGIPLATWYWKDCCGVTNSNESVLKLAPGKEACTCHACIVSQALICARNSTPLDYCSTIIISGTNIPPVSLETLEVKMVVLVAVGIILVILVLLVITVIVILKRRRRNAKVRQRYKESNQSEEMQELMRIRGIQSSTLIGSDDPNLGAEESTKKRRLIRENGPCSAKCTFCGKEMKMFILSCEHSGGFLPTCIKCASSPKPCEICNASKKEYMEYTLWTDLANTISN